MEVGDSFKPAFFEPVQIRYGHIAYGICWKKRVKLRDLKSAAYFAIMHANVLSSIFS